MIQQSTSRVAKATYKPLKSRISSPTRNDYDIKETEESSKNAEARPRQIFLLLDKQGREIYDQDKILERIEEFYTELYDSEQSTIIHTDPKDVPVTISWEVEAILRDMKNGTATGYDYINSLQEQGIEDMYIELFKEIYTNSSLTVHLRKESNKINTGIWQGDTLSPNIRKHIPMTDLGNHRFKDRR